MADVLTRLKIGMCNRARLDVTKQYSSVSLCGSVSLVPTENIRFGCALWSSSSVIFFPHDTCVGRKTIKSITLLVRQLCFRKTAKVTASLSIVLLEHVYVLWFTETQKTGKFHQFVAYLAMVDQLHS